MAGTSPPARRPSGRYVRRVPVDSVMDAAERVPVCGGARQRWTVVSRDGEPGHPFDNHAPLAPGTVVEELCRFERWDHQGCIQSSLFITADMRVVGSSREGEVVEVILGAGDEHEYDPCVASPTWLERLPESPTP